MAMIRVGLADVESGNTEDKWPGVMINTFDEPHIVLPDQARDIARRIMEYADKAEGYI